MITITESAQNKIIELLKEEDNDCKLRMFVEGGGCAGFAYGFSFDKEKLDDDLEIPIGNFSILIDYMSMQYVENCSVDYVENEMGSEFKITNPLATTTCGCGSSFSI